MAIRKKVIINCFIVFTFISIRAIPQTIERKSFVFNSLENAQVKVTLELDNVKDNITIVLSPSEVLCIKGYQGDVRFEEFKVIDRKVLFLSFPIRGGSGIALVKTIFLCVSKGHLYKALDIVSKESFIFKKTFNKKVDSLELYDESGIYKINFIGLRKNDIGGYKLLVSQYEKVNSKRYPDENYKTTDTLLFNLDKKNKIFYNHIVKLKGIYIIESEKSSKQRDFKGEKYPEIEFKKHSYLFETFVPVTFIFDEYIFIDGVWYKKGNENYLIEVSDNCN